MILSEWTNAESSRAQEIWSEYERQHELADKVGQTAGIDPASGCIWFGGSVQSVVAQRDASGSSAPLYFIRIGSSSYFRKGGHR
jgi:hypothetical protein